ncbi:hypothetical protein GCK72_019753 [Caenorhabditis remanei]|uniref:Serpentine Receptor, class H n=1 Tax=Caenorhabditis remanei TaxID=31234 RepID=A0A6A5GD76_CAERE|nr:hypothetical protein GCK72_019753 [Caenorhabditis remanei]KAF1753197.1 hypothetical protein GCK72_019753 [Caenorhabditis remanei]
MGLIHYTGLDTGIVLYFGITMMAFVGVSIVSIFENRYFILCGQNTWWRRVRYPFLIVNYLLASVHYIPTLIEIPDQIAGREGMFTMYPKARVFDNPENPIYVISYEKNDWYAIREASIILMFTAEVTGFVIPVQIYMRRAVKKFNLSEHSISIQKTFLRALHLQIAIPALIMLLPHVATAILGIFVMVAVSIITIFENRYFLIFAEHTWWRHARYPFLAINYILGLLYYLPTVLSVPEQSSAREIIFKEFPEFRALDTPSNPVYVLVLNNPWVSVRQIAMEATVVIETLIIVLLLKMKMKNVVKEMKMSESTAKLQKAFLKALYIQVSLPLLVILIPSAISVFSGILGISTQSVNNLVYITFSCHGLVSTIVMLTIQMPYREFCMGMVGKSDRRQRKVTVSNISARSSTQVTTF